MSLPTKLLLQEHQHLLAEELADLVGNSLSSEHRALVERHLSVCDACRMEVEMVKAAMRRRDDVAVVDRLLVTLKAARRSSRWESRSDPVRLKPQRRQPAGSGDPLDLAAAPASEVTAGSDDVLDPANAEAAGPDAPVKTVQIGGRTYEMYIDSDHQVVLAGWFEANWRTLVLGDKAFSLQLATNNQSRAAVGLTRLALEDSLGRLASSEVRFE